MRKTTLSVFIVLLFFSLSAAQIRIIVQENAGITRLKEPVTLGVPFKKGELNSEASVGIVSKSGTQVEAQFKVMATWSDKSIKWLKCDFQADVNANTVSEYSLVKTSSSVRRTELTSSESDSDITVITGPLKFTVDKKYFKIFDRVWFDMNSDRIYSPDEVIINQNCDSMGAKAISGGKDYFSSRYIPDNIEIEESGPMKVVIKVSGKHYNSSDYKLKYETRIYAYAGKSYVKVYHVYANGTSMPNLNNPAGTEYGVNVNKYSLNFNLNMPGQKYVSFGLENNELKYNLPEGKKINLIQYDRNTVETPLSFGVSEGNNLLGNGSRAEGWVDISNEKWGVTVSDRYFWQKYPKGLSFSDNGLLSIDLLPSTKLLYAGIGTGDEITINFHQKSDNYDAGKFAYSVSKHPLYAIASPQQIAKSEAFYPLPVGNNTPFPGMDKYINDVTRNHLSNIEDLQLYGNFNYGDVTRDKYEILPNRDESTWGNNYYDCILTATRLFAQTGDLNFADIFIPMAWHFMETDCWNTYDPNDWLNGFCSTFSSYHRGYANFNAHFAEGLWYYYYLTGDERAREISLRAANSIVHQQAWANENVLCRTAYQRGSVCLEAWKNTRDSVYLSLAKHLIIDKILATQDTFGVLGGVDAEGGTVIGEQSWMMSLFSDVLWKYLIEVDDPDAVIKLEKIANFLDRYARINPGSEEYWNLFLPPSNTNPPTAVTEYDEPKIYWSEKGLIAGTYAYVYHLTGKEYYKNLAINILQDTWKNPDINGQEFWGKASCQAMKNLLHAVGIVYGDTLISSVNLTEVNKTEEFSLMQNYPNPFNPETVINYSVGKSQSPDPSKVELKVYDILGREIKTLVNETKAPGKYQIKFDGSDLSSGVYIYSIKIGNYFNTKKALLQK